ncbi:MAG: ribosome small subunit-dependent GTPase A [Bacteroidales bacterium]|nr:ribosome small subunit-dependent GTPase A [Bacteroidales bacterium]
MYGINNYKNELNIADEVNIGRVIEKTNYIYTIADSNYEFRKAETVSNLQSNEVFVGDFVEYTLFDDYNLITSVKTRLNSVSKKASYAAKSFHEAENEQLLAANVDQLFVLIAADQRFTLSKFERYVFTFQQDNIDMHVLISKGDFEDLAEDIKQKILSVYPNFKVTVFSNLREESLIDIKKLFLKDKTSLLIGASGAGKSTLINNLLNDYKMNTNEVRIDGKGKHTTTTTKMFYSDNLKSYIIDSPGFKTISTTRDIDKSVLFEDIQKLSLDCKFNDCTHTHEPKCAVLNAIENGEMSEAYYKRYKENLRVVKGQLRHEQRKKVK